MGSVSNHIQLSLENQFIRITLLSLGILLAAVPLIYEILRYRCKPSIDLMKELYLRYYSWLFLAVFLILPLLAGRLFTICSVTLVSIFCFAEYAKATGLTSSRPLLFSLIGSILLYSFLAVDNWLVLFNLLSLLSLALLLLAAFGLKQTGSKLNKFHFAIIAFSFFAVYLGHFAYFANYEQYIPIMLMVLICVELNDVFAYICGKLLGKKQLCPKISPNKTVAGFTGAIILTTGLFYFLGSFVFKNSPLSTSMHLIGMGLITAFFGQFGDLMISGIKRYLTIKDFGKSLPGHGGFLDRFDSLLLVSPILFHYINYFNNSSLNQNFRVFTG